MNNGENIFVFCTECGAKNDINANFCTSCGNRLVKPEQPQKTIVLPVTPQLDEAEIREEQNESLDPVTEEPIPEEAPVEEPVAEVAEEEEAVPVFIPEAGEPAIEDPALEEPAEEEIAPEIIPVIIPEAEEPEIEDPALEEPAEEEFIPETEESEPEESEIEESAEEEIREEDPAPAVIPVILPEVEEAKDEEPTPVAEEPENEEKAEEESAPPVVVPVPVKVSKKEAKLEKKLEEAKKQAQEEARKQAQKEAEKAKKAEEKARAAEEKAKKAESKKAENVQSNSHYYYNNDAGSSAGGHASEKPKKKRKQNFFLKILSFLLAIILMASLVVAIPITLLNMFLTDHNIEVIVERAISSIELDKIEFSTADGTKTLSGALHDITNEFEGWDHITEEQISDALLEDFVKQFVTDAISQLGMSLKEGEVMLGWTPEQIYDFIEANEDTIEKLARDAGYEGKLPIKEKKEMMIQNIEKRIGEDGITAETLFGGSDETKQLARYLDAAQAVFSINILYLAWGLVAFVILLIIFTNIGYFGAFCRTCGFPAFIIGTLYFLIGLAVSPLLSIVTIPVPMFADAIKFTVGFLGALLMDISLIVLAVGLVLIIISFISDAIRRKIDSKNNA